MHTLVTKLVPLGVEKYYRLGYMAFTEIQLKILCRYHGSLSQQVPDPWPIA